MYFLHVQFTVDRHGKPQLYFSTAFEPRRTAFWTARQIGQSSSFSKSATYNIEDMNLVSNCYTLLFNTI